MQVSRATEVSLKNAAAALAMACAWSAFRVDCSQTKEIGHRSLIAWSMLSPGVHAASV
jgi:hypothetical protein